MTAIAERGLATRDERPLAARWTAEEIQLIKGTVAKNATDTELQLFLQVAAATGLNPFLKEIWFIKYQTREGKWVGPVIMTSRDGYLSIANKHPAFEGIQSFAVYENDEFAYDADTNHVTHRFTGKRGRLVGAWARVKRRGRDPVIAWASYEEYKGTSEPWVKYPSAMTCKVAEAFALKRQFTISGLVTQEELDVATAPPERQPLPAKERPRLAAETPATQPADRILSAAEVWWLRDDVTAVFRQQSWPDEATAATVKAHMRELGAASVDALTLHQAEAFRRWAREIAAGGVPDGGEPAPDDAAAHFAEL